MSSFIHQALQFCGCGKFWEELFRQILGREGKISGRIGRLGQAQMIEKVEEAAAQALFAAPAPAVVVVFREKQTLKTRAQAKIQQNLKI